MPGDDVGEVVKQKDLKTGSCCETTFGEAEAEGMSGLVVWGEVGKAGRVHLGIRDLEMILGAQSQPGLLALQVQIRALKITITTYHPHHFVSRCVLSPKVRRV